MKRILPLIAACAITSLHPEEAKPLKGFILAGQSNKAFAEATLEMRGVR